jgi:hypothetical protein
VFFTCPLLDSRKKLVFVACNKKHKKTFYCPLKDTQPKPKQQSAQRTTTTNNAQGATRLYTKAIGNGLALARPEARGTEEVASSK